MKRIYTLSTFCIIVLLLSACKSTDQSSLEKDAIRSVIQSAYIDAVFNEGDVDKIKSGWDPGCSIYVLDQDNDTCIAFPAYGYLPRFRENPSGLAPGTSAEIPYIHIAGYAAIAVVEVINDDNQIYTDYINLYKFKDGWKIVTKTYYTWPR